MTELLGHFDELYASSEDPFGYEDRWFEIRKRAITVASLPRRRYERAFEPGCSIGTLTAELAPRCGSLLAADAAPAAVELARRRTAGLSNVLVERLEVPREWPAGRFDLFVVSELGYYLSDERLDALLEQCASSAAPKAHLAAVHWLGEADDFALPGGGAAVHDAIAARKSWHRLVTHRDDHFVLDVFEWD